MPDSLPIIGRKPELATLERAFTSPKSEFVVLYGRRRVGKTFLINQLFGSRFTFRMTALSGATLTQQLINFHTTLKRLAPDLAGEAAPETWFMAFQLIIQLAEADPRERKVIFFDELPWFDTYGSDFLQALEHFWNSWVALRNDILLIGCGSAASWMINRLIHHHGGLHNRITARISLQPFTLAETEAFLQAKGATYDRYQLLELYMAMGGIPFYLEQIETHRSIAQNIDRLFFSPEAILHLEYEDLYRSLFHRADRHISLVEALAQRPRAMSRADLLKAAGLSDGGSATQTLEELEQSGFIQRDFPFGRSTRGGQYRLIDPYTVFYLSFVADSKSVAEGTWLYLYQSPRWRAWSGYAFESLCKSHIQPLKQALGIGAVYAEVSSWSSKASDPGAQIDLLIDRNDRVISVCEMKFSVNPFVIDKTYAARLQHKLRSFQAETGTTKALFLTLITTFGLKENAYSHLAQDSLDMNALFGATG